MTDIISDSDPRVRVELTFHPDGDPLVVSLPRPDFLKYDVERAMQSDWRRMKQDADRTLQDIRRTHRRNQIEWAKYDKAFGLWEKKLRDPEVEDPGPEPEEPTTPELPEVPTGRDAERAAALVIYKHLLAPDEYAVVEKCTTAELLQGQAAWEKASEVPLGELLASPTSSTETTEGLSEPTSSTPDGPRETSETESPGETSETS